MFSRKLIVGLIIFIGLGSLACNVNIAGVDFDSVDVGELRTENRAVELAGAERVTTKISFGAGELNLEGGATNLADSEFRYNIEGWTPEVAYGVEDGHGTLRINQPSLEKLVLPSEEMRNKWDIKLNDDVPLDLKLEMGAGQSQLDLRGLNLTKFVLNAGAGEVHINLADTSVPEINLEAGIGEMTVDLSGPWHNDLKANISSGIGGVTLKVPRDVGVRIKAETGIGEVSAIGLNRQDGAYVNSAYGESDITLNIEMQGGVGEIILIQEG